MSKERLESLKRNREWTEATGEKFYTVDKKDYEWLIKQAERLEAIIKHRNDILKANEYLNEQNKRYREALEFYADENNYREQELKGIVPPRPITFKPILRDYGSIARKALEGEE